MHISNKTFGNEKVRIDQKRKLLKIKLSKILSNLFNKKYMLKFGEFNNNTTWTERVKI